MQERREEDKVRTTLQVNHLVAISGKFYSLALLCLEPEYKKRTRAEEEEEEEDDWEVSQKVQEQQKSLGKIPAPKPTSSIQFTVPAPKAGMWSIN